MPNIKMYFLKIDPNNLMHHKIRPNSQIGPRVINHQTGGVYLLFLLPFSLFFFPISKALCIILIFNCSWSYSSQLRLFSFSFLFPFFFLDTFCLCFYSIFPNLILVSGMQPPMIPFAFLSTCFVHIGGRLEFLFLRFWVFWCDRS